MTPSNLILLATAVSSAVIPRDDPQILSDLRKMASDVQAYTSSVKSWPGGTLKYLGVCGSHASDVNQDLLTAYEDAKSSAGLSEQDSQSIVDYINNTLQQSIPPLVQSLKDKNVEVADAGVSGEIVGEFQKYTNHTGIFSQYLATKLAADKKDAAVTSLANIETYFQDVITYYHGAPSCS